MDALVVGCRRLRRVITLANANGYVYWTLVQHSLALIRSLQLSRRSTHLKGNVINPS